MTDADKHKVLILALPPFKVVLALPTSMSVPHIHHRNDRNFDTIPDIIILSDTFYIALIVDFFI